MIDAEAQTPVRSVWQQGLLLALLVWLLTVFLHVQTFNSGRVYEIPSLPKYLHLGLAEWSEIWFLACVVSLVAAVALMARAADIPIDDAAPLGIMLIVGFYNRPTGISFEQAQVNLPLLVLLCTAYLCERQNRPYRMAAALAAAALIQTWMLGLLLYLLMRRRPLAFIWGIVFFSGLLALLMASAGLREPAAAAQYLLQSFHLDLHGYANQSIFGFARVHFGAGGDAQPWINDPMTMHWVAGGAVAVVAAGLWTAFGHAPAVGSEQARLQLGFLVVSLLLVLPVCERAWFVLLLPAIWTLLCSDAMSAAVRGTTVAVYAILTRSFPVPRLAPQGLAALAPSAYFMGAAALWLILLVALGHSRRRSVAQSFTFHP